MWFEIKCPLQRVSNIMWTFVEEAIPFHFTQQPCFMLLDLLYWTLKDHYNLLEKRKEVFELNSLCKSRWILTMQNIVGLVMWRELKSIKKTNASSVCYSVLPVHKSDLPKDFFFVIGSLFVPHWCFCTIALGQVTFVFCCMDRPDFCLSIFESV